MPPLYEYTKLAKNSHYHSFVNFSGAIPPARSRPAMQGASRRRFVATPVARLTCANCLVHCRPAEMREQIRVVMRWAGPRMLLRHPIMGIAHMIDEHRPVPTLPAKPAKKSNQIHLQFCCQRCCADEKPSAPIAYGR